MSTLRSRRSAPRSPAAVDVPRKDENRAPGPAAVSLADSPRLSLQRRSIESSFGRPALQRYTVHPPAANWQGLGRGMKVSDDGKMAVQDIALYPEGMGRAHQEFYATADIIASATATLTGLRSAYRVQQGAALPQPSPGGQTLHRVVVHNQVLDAAATPLNCDDNAAQFLGIEMSTDAERARHQMVAHLTQTPLLGAPRAKDVALSPDSSFDPGRTEALRDITGKKDPGTALDRYRQFDERKKAKAARKVGINQFARPPQGGAYGVFGDRHGHFAPVLARSGVDDVTLEAHFHENRNGPAAGEIQEGDRSKFNPEWYFQMYGPVKQGQGGAVDDQTFYGRHVAQDLQQGGAPDRALSVIAYGKTGRPPAGPAEALAMVQTAAALCQAEAAKKVALAPGSQALSATLQVLVAPPVAQPAQAPLYVGWLQGWAAAIDQHRANRPALADPTEEKWARLALLAGARHLRRCALMLG